MTLSKDLHAVDSALRLGMRVLLPPGTVVRGRGGTAVVLEVDATRPSLYLVLTSSGRYRWVGTASIEKVVQLPETVSVDVLLMEVVP